MHLLQHKLCIKKTELALEVKSYLNFHRVTWPRGGGGEGGGVGGGGEGGGRMLTNGRDVKYVFRRGVSITQQISTGDNSFCRYIRWAYRSRKNSGHCSGGREACAYPRRGTECYSLIGSCLPYIRHDCFLLLQPPSQYFNLPAVAND